MRVRIATLSGCCGGRLFGGGELHYYDAYQGNDFPLIGAVAAGGRDRGGTPGRFAIRQALAVPSDLPVRALRAGGSSPFQADRSSAHREGGATAWSPGHGIRRLLIAVPETRPRVRVRLRIHDLDGRLVRRVIEEPLEPGYYLYTWNGRNEDGDALSPGAYLAVMAAGDYSGLTKLVLTR